MLIVPQIFCDTGTKKEISVAFKICQNQFSAPDSLWELTTLPRPASRLERGHPSPYSTPLGTNTPLVLAVRPPRIPASQTYAYGCEAFK